MNIKKDITIKRKHEKRWDEWKTFRWFGDMKIEKQVVPRVQILAKYLQNNFKILDICCGAGRYYKVIVEDLKLISNSNYVGIDNSEGMLLEAKRRYEKGDFHNGDAYDLEFSDQSFDMCLLMDVIQHVPDYKPIIKEMFRVSKKYMIFVTWWTDGKEINKNANSDKISKHINKHMFIKFLKTLNPKEIKCEGTVIIFMK